MSDNKDQNTQEKETREEQEHQNEENSGAEAQESQSDNELDNLKAENEKLKDDNQQLHDKYLRLMSEFDNFRKRTRQEKEELVKNASEGLIKDLLPVIDDLERALQYLEDEGKAEEKGFEGVKLIHEKFKKLLTDKGVEEIPAMGEPFDSEYHEALSMMEAPSEDKKDTVIDLVQKGYKLNDKIIRHAKVIVGK